MCVESIVYEGPSGFGSQGPIAPTGSSAPVQDTPEDEVDLEYSLPWIQPVIILTQSFNLCCTHQNFCHPSCARRQTRAARRLMESVRRFYGEQIEYIEEMFINNEQEDLTDMKKGRWSKWSESASTSPDHKKDMQVGGLGGSSREGGFMDPDGGQGSREKSVDGDQEQPEVTFDCPNFLKYLQLKVTIYLFG